MTIRWLRSEWKKRSPYDKTKELSEVGRAARFAEYFCGTIRHTMDTNEWYRWSGITWKKVFQDEVVGVVAYTLDDLLRHDIKELGLEEDKSANAFYRQMQNSKKAKAILEESCHFGFALLGCCFSHFGVVAGAETLCGVGPYEQAHRHRRIVERLAVGVAYYERHSLYFLVVHVAYCVAAATTHAHYLDDG